MAEETVKNVDAGVLLQMRAWVSVPVCFSFHGDQLLDRTAKPAVQTITALIGTFTTSQGVAFEIHKSHTAHGDRREFILS
jgi:hypothetical protein